MRRTLVTLLTLGALALPAGVLAAAAEQIVIRVVDQPTFFLFEDPCRGGTLVGEGTESGVIRVTDLGTRGFHVRGTLRGSVDLYDADDNLVGMWTYRVHFTDQFPPEGQGALHSIASGPLEYVDGETANVRFHYHAVFEKGDIVKREFFKDGCAGA